MRSDYEKDYPMPNEMVRRLLNRSANGSQNRLDLLTANLMDFLMHSLKGWR